MSTAFYRSNSVRVGAGIAAIAVAIPVGIMLTTVSAQSAPTPAPAKKAAVKVAPVPSTKLITAKNLPAGWTQMAIANPTSAKKAEFASILKSATVTPSACKASFTMPAGYQAMTYRAFSSGSQYGPYLGQAVARFSSPAAAKAAIAKAAKAAAACKSVTVNVPSYGSGSAKVAALAVPVLGEQRVGYQVNGTAMGYVPIKAQVMIVRKGAYVTVVGQGGAFSLKAGATLAATKAAAAKL